MKEKFLKSFGSKSLYISIISVVLCAGIAGGAVFIVHNNNKKLQATLDSLTDTGTVSAIAEDTAVPATEAQSAESKDKENGDKALQYLAEYDRITAAYEKRKAELEKGMPLIPTETTRKPPHLSAKPNKSERYWSWTDEEYSKYLDQYEKKLAAWEEESRTFIAEESRYAAELASQKAEAEKVKVKQEQIKKQLSDLEKQYKKDIEKLKKQYGI